MDQIKEIERLVMSRQLKSGWLLYPLRLGWTYFLAASYGAQAFFGIFGGGGMIYLGLKSSTEPLLLGVGGVLCLIGIHGLIKYIRYVTLLFMRGWLLVTDQDVFIKKGRTVECFSFANMTGLRIITEQGFHQRLTFIEKSTGMERDLLRDRVFGAPSDLLPVLSPRIR